MRMRDSNFETPTARSKLAPRWRPYNGPVLARGISLMYRRNANGAGSWIVRAANGRGKYWSKAFAVADDYDKADDSKVLTFFQAQDHAKALARGGNAEGAGKPLTVAEALTAYENDLKARGRSPKNGSILRYRLRGDALLDKPVAMLQEVDLIKWRNRLIAAGMKPATFNRTKNAFQAALGLAARLDARIDNHRIFRAGLKRLKDGNNARRAVLEDAQVLRIVAEAQAEGEAFALMTEALAQTGARWSQLVRMNCDALRGGNKLMVPSSYKGNESKRQVVASVPITAALAIRLAKACAGRGRDELLFPNRDGVRWTNYDEKAYRRKFAAIVARIGLDADMYTPYSLRHSSICRALKAGVPMSITAKLHDTSAKEIEAHYARYIEDVAEDIARRGLLQDPTDNVVSLKGVA